MILVSEAGSMRRSAFCEASAWPLVTSYSIQDLAATCGVGTPCASTAAGAASATVTAIATGARADAKRGVALFIGANSNG
ncbi:hypothetical protein D3C87_1127050 [compost metagenome]